jgi:competence protein ComEC
VDRKKLQVWIYYITPSCILGIIVGENIKISLSLIITFISILSIIIIFYSFYDGRFTQYLIIALFLIIGIFVISLTQSEMSQSILLKLSEEKSFVRVEGNICSRPNFFKNSVSFSLQVKYIDFNGKRYKVNDRTQITLFNNLNKNLNNDLLDKYKKLNSIDDLKDSISLGNRIVISGRLNKIEIEISKGFSWEKYLYHNKIQTNLVTDASKIEDISIPFLSRIRKYVVYKAKKLFKERMNPKYSAFLIGAVLGDRSEILPETIEHFTKSGLLHLLAISGQNMVLISSTIIFFYRIFTLSFFKRIFITIIMIISYTYLVGYEASVLRASITTLLTMFTLILGRKKDSFALLSTSALFLTLWDPFSIYDVGFQLSFLSVAGIFLISPIIMKLFNNKKNLLTNTFSITFSVQLAIAPITLYHFKQFSIVSILSNFLALPVSSLILSLGMICVWLSLIFEKMIYPLLWILDKATAYLFIVSKFCAKIPYGQFYCSKFSIYLVIIYFSFIIISLYFFKRTNVEQKVKNKFLISLIVLLIVVVFTYQFLLSLPPKNLSITFFDVGNGDACLVRTPEGHDILIDGGPEGKNIVKKLHLKGVKKLNLVILSHPHADHIGGLIEVLNEIPVNLVLVGSLDLSDCDHSVIDKYNSFLEIIRSKNINIKCIKPKDILNISSKLSLFTIWPDPDKIFLLKSNLNNQSLVFLLRYANKKILFTGDVEIEAQKEILNDLKNLSINADILKVPHQGSKDANFYPFFKAVSPNISIIPVGLNNKNNHPSDEIIKSLNSINCPILRTDKMGDINLIAKSNNWKISTER